MLVVATRLGFYGNKRIQEGKKFNLKKKEDFSKNWMMEAKQADKEKKAKEQADEVVTFDDTPETHGQSEEVI